MSYSTPPTFITGAVLTAPELQTLSDDVIDLDRRTVPVTATVLTIESTTGTSYTDLATAGPSVTVIIGATGKAQVGLYGAMSNAGSNFALMSFAVSGATTIAATDTYSLQTATPSDVRHGAVWILTGLNPGSTTFTAKYRATATTASFNGRMIWVTPLGS